MALFKIFCWLYFLFDPIESLTISSASFQYDEDDKTYLVITLREVKEVKRSFLKISFLGPEWCHFGTVGPHPIMHYIPTWPCHTWFGKPFNHLHVQNWWKCMSSVGIMTKRIWKHCIFVAGMLKTVFPLNDQCTEFCCKYSNVRTLECCKHLNIHTLRKKLRSNLLVRTSHKLYINIKTASQMHAAPRIS